MPRPAGVDLFRGAALLIALAVVAGVADGVRHVAVDRLAGDDFTALLGR
jgi:hypothetical protein